MTTPSSILAWKNSTDRGAWWATVHGVPKSQTQLSDEAQAPGESEVQDSLRSPDLIPHVS